MTYKDVSQANRLSWQRMCAGLPFIGLSVSDTFKFRTRLKTADERSFPFLLISYQVQWAC
jgi:hypothetical protein